jgi:hypothetical protein
MKRKEKVRRRELKMRRKDYTRLAGALATICELEYGRLRSVEIDDGLERYQLIDAVHDHYDALMCKADFFDRKTLKRFYADMRMHGDDLTRRQEGK